VNFLNRRQQSDLIELINEEFGADLTKEEFIDVAFRLFEDIAGFETASEDETFNLIELLWRQYDE
jgi:oligoendopeptidase F